MAVNCETKQLVLNVHVIVTEVHNLLFFPLLKNNFIAGVNIHIVYRVISVQPSAL